MGMTLFVVLFPIFVTSDMFGMSQALQSFDPPTQCLDQCRVVIAESIPENLTYIAGSPISRSTYDVWKELLFSATSSIDLAVFYWTLRGEDVYQDPSDWQLLERFDVTLRPVLFFTYEHMKGEEVFKSLVNAAKDPNIQMRIAQNLNTTQPEALELAKAGAEVRNLNFTAWFIGNGLLHTKLWVIDGRHFYVGSANMDWRSLTQVKEIGAAVFDCPCLAEDMSKLFSVYWDLGKPNAQIPDTWPPAYATQYNAQTPMQLSLNDTTSHVFISSSPAPFCPKGRTSDIDSILHVIYNAKEYIYVAVMDYFPTTLYNHPTQYWPVIDDALRAAAFDRGVEVRVMASWWKHSWADIARYLRSLEQLNGVRGARGQVKVQVKLFYVPAFTPAQREIPFARVNHNKYMVTENTAYIGTSNWSGDYFISTGGIGLIVNQTADNSKQTRRATAHNTTSAQSNPTMQQQLVAIFLRDWNSVYAKPVDNATVL